MQIDAQSLADLEVFGTRSGQPGLFQRLDRTRTSAGRQALKRRFAAPMSEPERIRGVQVALGFIAENEGVFKLLPTELELTGWGRYLGSNALMLGPGRRARPAWLRMRLHDRHVYEELRAGVGLSLKLLERLRGFQAGLLRLEPPAALREPLEELGGLLDMLPRAGQPSGWRVLVLDQQLRGAEAPGRLLALLGELEALRALAQVQRELGWALPELVEGEPRFEAVGLRHPLLAAGTPNDLGLDAERPLLFLTGANMAGKTTFLKACALAVLLAQLGLGVPAESCKLTPFDALFAGLQVFDDLAAGISYFQAETRRARELAALLAAGSTFVIYDEIFKGTNVADAQDACFAVIQGLLRSNAGLYLIASHLTELAEALQAEPGIRLAAFEADLAGEVPRFEHRLRDGISRQRLGMHVMRQEGVLDAFARLGVQTSHAR